MRPMAVRSRPGGCGPHERKRQVPMGPAVFEPQAIEAQASSIVTASGPLRAVSTFMRTACPGLRA